MYHLFKNKKNIAGIFLFFFFICMILADYKIFTVRTPYGTVVPDTWYRNEQYDDDWKSYIETEALKLYPGIKILNYYWPGEQYTPTTTYNCHAFAWHMTEVANGASNKVWIGMSQGTAEDVYWTDGSYIEVPQSEATKVSYPASMNHSAITTGTTNVFISKWGSGVLCRHKKNEGDFATTAALKFYKRRNPSVQAKFTYSKLTDYKVQFTDQSTATDCSIINRTWTFGDGATSTATNPIHVYSQSGDYNVSLIVEGNYNAGTSTDSETISIGSIQDFVITNPDGGEVWEIGKTYKVEWDPNNGISGNLRMNLLQNNQYKGMLYGTVANDGDKSWTIDEYKGGEPIAPGSNYQVQLVSKLDPSKKTKSGYFTIVQ